MSEEKRKRPISIEYKFSLNIIDDREKRRSHTHEEEEDEKKDNLIST